MKVFPRVEEITPQQFELQVKSWIESVAPPLEAFSANHLESLRGRDGEYAIDVTARFKAFEGATFLVIIECKKHKDPIKREVVQVLREKQISLGAQKAIVVSTSKFQSGAIEYASHHGIALVQLVEGSFAYIQASAVQCQLRIPKDAEDYAGLIYCPDPTEESPFPLPFTGRQNYFFCDYLLSDLTGHVGSQ
jgi:restriction system protein